MKSLSRALVALAAVSGAATSVARADAPNLAGYPNSAPFVAASTGTVTVTFLFSRASFTNYLILFDALGGTGTTLITVPGNYPNVGIGAPLSVSFAVTAGDPLLFGLCTAGATGGNTSVACSALTGGATGNTWYNGLPAPDTFIHSKVISAATWNGLNGPCLAESPPCYNAPVGSTVVGFEDKAIPNPDADEPDFNDIVFAFENVAETIVPEPATMGLLALGLVGMSGAGLLRRRSARKNNK